MLESNHWFAWTLTFFSVVLALTTTAHILTHKRESRSAITWIGLVWMAPIFGVIFYFLFGINRINRRLHHKLTAFGKLILDKTPSSLVAAPPEWPQASANV